MPKILIVLTIGASILLFCADAATQTIEKRIWACKVSSDAEEDLWLVEMGASNSYVKLYGNRIWGDFSYEGEDRRWDFDRRSDGLARYSAILKPDNSVDYYDFENAKAGEQLTASYHYICREAD
jgi:hypothetical protein